MSYRNLRGLVGRVSKREPIPATGIDVLGTKCSVRLSSRGGILSALSYSGKVPAKGDSVYVDYSRGVPIVLTSDDDGNNTAPINDTGAPLIWAAETKGSSSLETTDNGTPWDSIVGVPVYALEDLSSQIDGVSSHFVLSGVAMENPIITCNLQQSPYSVLVDETMDGFTLTYTPTTRDVIIAQYRIAGTV